MASLEASAQNGLSAVTEPQTITTSFADTDKTVVLPDAFGDGKVFQEADSGSKLADGSIAALKPGFYSLHVRSYCLHAGAAGPTQGAGYLYAPLKGPYAELIRGILAGTYIHPQIPQHDVQTLIWSMLARAKLDQLSTTMQLEAAQLLSPAQLAELETGGVPALEQAAMQKLIDSAPASVRESLAFENELRAALVDASTSYAELERLAVPPPLPLSSNAVPLGRWSRHPGGYFVRYLPNSYTSMLVQVYVPTNVAARLDPEPRFALVAEGDSGGLSFSLVGDVAVPANTGSQRLAASNVPVAGSPPPATSPAPPPKPNCDKKASDYPVLNYGVPNGEIASYDNHDPRIDIYADGKSVATRDDPVFLSLRPSIDMNLVNGKGGTNIAGTGNAQLTGATVLPEPWLPKPTASGMQPGKDWGDVVAVKARYSYTKSDGTLGVLTFYLEYLHLISPSFPAPANNVPCIGLGPLMTNGKKLSPADLANRPLIGFEGAVNPPHVHVNARLVDGSSPSGYPNGPFVDPTLVLNGDH